MTPMSMTPMAPMAPLRMEESQPWWPSEWGTPQSSGSQNNLRYALFPSSSRLAVERNGEITLYDTADHAVQSVSQQSGSEQLMVVTAGGPVPLSALRRISGSPSSTPAAQGGAGEPATAASPPAAAEQDVLVALEKLAELKSRGILTDEEFAAKKAELLRRL